MMYKGLQDGTNVYEALFELRNTPQQDTGLSPTQLMFVLTDKNQISSGHKPTSKQEAVSNDTEETYPKATDREAKLQQVCKRPGSTPNRTTSVLAALGGTEVEKGDGPKPQE